MSNREWHAFDDAWHYCLFVSISCNKRLTILIIQHNIHFETTIDNFGTFQLEYENNVCVCVEQC